MMLLWLALAHGGVHLSVSGDVAEIGRTSTILVTDDADHPLPGQTVRVVHRPGLAGEQEQAVGITDAQGEVAWSPATPGLTRLRAGDTWETVHVTGPPPVATYLAVLILLAAAVGGLAFGLRSRPRL